jgi:5-(carboxyamino)imidazole ribonucleotide mutase
MLAVQMLSLQDESIKNKLIEKRLAMKKKFIDENGEGVEL